MNKKEEFDERSLKDSIFDKKLNFYSNICKDYNQSPFNMVVDYMFKVFDAQVEGFEDTFSIKIALYHVFGGKELLMVDKYVNLNILLTRYESYLKKIYYLIHDEEVEGQDGKSASLADSIHAFECLWNLKYGHTEEAQKYSQYLQMLRDWRNNFSSHNAPVASEQEIDAAIQIVVAMYLYVTGNSITDLEMAGYDAEESKQEHPIIPLSYDYDGEEERSLAAGGDELHSENGKYITTES